MNIKIMYNLISYHTFYYKKDNKINAFDQFVESFSLQFFVRYNAYINNMYFVNQLSLITYVY